MALSGLWRKKTQAPQIRGLSVLTVPGEYLWTDVASAGTNLSITTDEFAGRAKVLLLGMPCRCHKTATYCIFVFYVILRRPVIFHAIRKAPGGSYDLAPLF